MTLEHILALLPRIRACDAYEILAASRYRTLEDWARSRLDIPGCAFSALEGDVVQACGGVLEGPVAGIGALWLVGSERLQSVAKHVLRVWRAIRDHGGFRRLECKCYAANDVANRFALRLGFTFEGTLRGYTLEGGELNQYGLVVGGTHGR
jgi:RimJ/RimL family protein N-acetyltransferase